MTTALVNRFYGALATSNGDEMAACYADTVVFEDPAFGELVGEDARDMWRMLCSRSAGLTVDHTILEVSDTSATVHWIANYTFSTGRHVSNDITATMTIADGLIVDHRDAFDLWAWSRQALGAPGALLGWSPPMQKKIRTSALGNLKPFQDKN